MLLLFFVEKVFPAASVFTGETNSAAEPPDKLLSEKPPEAQQAMRSYLQLQEQMHTALLAIEQARAENDAAAKRNADAITTRLKTIEQAITLQREREVETARASNRWLLMVAGTFASAGILTMLLTAWFQSRAMNRLVDLAAAFRGTAAFTPAALTAGDAPPAGFPTPDSIGRQLLSAIERIEKRVNELEHPAQLVPAVLVNGHHNGTAKDVVADAAPASTTDTANTSDTDTTERVAMMLGKGQTLLNLNQAEQALACFEVVVALEPNHAEALVKKGATLERLNRLEDALECYDRAIAADPTLTLAWLHKGGLFNQLERFDEALECYEHALRSQQKAGVE